MVAVIRVVVVIAVAGVSFPVTLMGVPRWLRAGLRHRARHEDVQSGSRPAYAAS